MSAAAGSVQRGFTLMELMLVILIIGLMLSSVSLSLPDSANKQLQQQAARLQAQIHLASQQSVFQNRDIGLLISADSYHFYSFEGERWVLLEPQSRFAPRRLPAESQFELQLAGQPINLPEAKPINPQEPQILFLSDGQMSDFQLALTSTEQSKRFTLRGELSGQTALSQSGPAP